MNAQKQNPLKQLNEYGQSVWFDYIRRNLIESGELKQLIKVDGLRGVTSNPAIFQKAFTGSNDYVTAIDSLTEESGLDAKAVYERLAIEDIKQAAKVLEPVYKSTRWRDGYVSLEVSPHLAHDVAGTCDEARRLWREIGRKNLMIKVPATPAGIQAVETLISDGINVNVTLLFSQEVYEQAAMAYIRGLEQRAQRGEDLSRIASVASFFISRIDTAVDVMLSEWLASGEHNEQRPLLQSLLGKVAIANAKLCYQQYTELFSSQRWQALEEQGAQTQRLLWASTSTKNPEFRDVLYIEELIGPDTVNTIPPATYDAFRQHGRLRPSLTEDLEAAKDSMETLEQVNISFADITDRLLADGLDLFAGAFDKVLAAVESARCAAAPKLVQRLSYSLSSKLTTALKAVLADWRDHAKVRRLWSRDSTLWTGSDESDWLGWLAITEEQQDALPAFQSLVADIRQAGFNHILLLGMGGSSLCPEVLAMTFGRQHDFPECLVLDSTDPAQVKAFADRIDPAHTLFIVSSKSGSTLEPNIFKQYFFERVRERLGSEEAGKRFIAITDPGSKLQLVAESDGFRRIFYSVPSIGGRYSALSAFGLVPAAAMGVDVAQLLDRTEDMVHACASCVPVEENPGLMLGAILGTLANLGRDKLTLITSPGIWDLGAWLEQLLAESTGKQGKGLIPVDGEPLGTPEVYGDDRVFVYLRLESAPDPMQDDAIDRLRQAGQPVVQIALQDIYDLGQEFFRWEFATAVAGSILGINPFNQPDVEASKIATRKLTSQYETTGSFPPETPLLEDSGIRLFTDETNARRLLTAVGSQGSLKSYITAYLDTLHPGDYFAVLAYIAMNPRHHEPLQAFRQAVRDGKRVATCLGYGPRFLHSTGQAYKGGPNTGVFLQITCDDAVDLPVPGHQYSFGVVKRAQAQGDFQVLVERERRVLRVHLGQDVVGGLDRLRDLVMQVMAEDNVRRPTHTLAYE